MLRSLLAATLLLFVFTSHAQPSSGGPTPINAVPIDGGISVLAASGVAYAVHRLRQRRRK